MMDQADLQEWNRQTIALMQALLGAISPNFRMVVLDRKSDQWSISFFLEQEDGEDREEIEDILGDFEALQEGYLDHNDEVIVSSGPLPLIEFPARVVYLRRERPSGENYL